VQNYNENLKHATIDFQGYLHSIDMMISFLFLVGFFMGDGVIVWDL
jgi:hypothetical protein